MAVTVDVELQVGRRMEEGRLLKVKEKGNDAVVPRRGNDAKRRIRSVRIARAKIETVRGQDSYTEGQLSHSYTEGQLSRIHLCKSTIAPCSLRARADISFLKLVPRGCVAVQRHASS